MIFNSVIKGKGGGAVTFTYTGSYAWYDDNTLALLSSGILTFTDSIIADTFVVGGGGGGGGSDTYVGSAGGSGGGAGYTNLNRVQYEKSVDYSAVIGAGGNGASGGSFSNNSRPSTQRGASGGTTSINGVSASGGQGGGVGYKYVSGSTYYGAYSGGNGGSGGGGSNSGAGGTDGSGGASSTYTGSRTCEGGTGQGSTTRAFGGSSEFLFSTGGTARSNKAGEVNTGNGGGGSNDETVGCSGGSGIILIRSEALVRPETGTYWIHSPLVS